MKRHLTALGMMLAASASLAQANTLITSVDAAQKQWAADLASAVRASWHESSASEPGSGRTIDCTIEIGLTRAGYITSLRVKKSCGSELLDSSAMRAVFRAEPLPVPEDEAAFVPLVTARFRP